MQSDGAVIRQGRLALAKKQKNSLGTLSVLPQ